MILQYFMLLIHVRIVNKIAYVKAPKIKVLCVGCLILEALLSIGKWHLPPIKCQTESQKDEF